MVLVGIRAAQVIPGPLVLERMSPASRRTLCDDMTIVVVTWVTPQDVRPVVRQVCARRGLIRFCLGAWVG